MILFPVPCPDILVAPSIRWVALTVFDPVVFHVILLKLFPFNTRGNRGPLLTLLPNIETEPSLPITTLIKGVSLVPVIL
ncbi:hypothetical protein ELBR111191_01835 [Elizabethkingia bruuniana]